MFDDGSVRGKHDEMLNKQAFLENTCNDNSRHSELTNHPSIQTRDNNVPNEENKGPVIEPLISVEYSTKNSVTNKPQLHANISEKVQCENII